MNSLTRDHEQSCDLTRIESHAVDAFRRFAAVLEQKGHSFDFAASTRSGNCIFVGEGDLSFALALAGTARSRPSNIVATTFETERHVSAMCRDNVNKLRRLGAKVIHGIDGRHFDDRRLPVRAELIAFQFPNTGTRRSVHGRTDNHVLLRRFLVCAASRLSATGRIVVTIVNSPHHLGAFDPTSAAKWAKCEIIDVLPFYRTQWRGYGHVNTNDADQSALSKYRSCSTWVFKPMGR